MRRLLAVVLLAGSFVLPARAQDTGSPEALRAAQELSGIITGDTIHQLSGTITAQMWPRIEKEFSGKVDKATLGDLRVEFEESLSKFTSEMMKDAPAIYARYFTAKELRDMIAFYKSPTGIKALHMMPKVMGDVTAQMVPRMQAFQLDLNDKVERVMKKHGYNKP
jgi:uncharacterized protein